jgi:DNA replication protein DnaC
MSELKIIGDVAQGFKGLPYEATLKAKSMGTQFIHCDTHGDVEVGYRFVSKGDGLFDFELKGCGVCATEKAQSDEAEKSRIEKAERERKRLEVAIGRANIPVRFQTRTLDSFTPTCDAAIKAHKAAKSYAQNFDEHCKNGQGLNFIGDVGTGKTHLAVGIALEAIKQGYTPLFISVFSAIRHIKDAWRRDSDISESEALNDLIAPDLLILDEIGVQFSSDTERLIIFDVLNRRYEDLRPTIIISNLMMDEISKVIGERVVDRLRECNKAYWFNWESYRARR